MKAGCLARLSFARLVDIDAQACGLMSTRFDAAEAAVEPAADDAAGEQRSRAWSAAAEQVEDLVAGDGQDAA